MDRKSDRALAARCLEGNEAAWDALISRYAPLIWSVLRRLGVPQADAEDLFQNVCLKLYGHLESLRDIEKLAGWIATVTRHEAMAWGRRRRSLSELPETLPDPAPRLDEALVEEERTFLVRDALGRLGEPCQTLLTRLYAEPPPPYAALAEELNMPLGSIGPRRARCLEKLRRILEG